ncbi:MAG: PilW family protein [Solirubrobacterales bacterium]
MIRFKARKGMTLVELLVALAILGVVMIPISLMLQVGYRSAVEENLQVTALGQARTAMTMMMDDLRRYDFENRIYDPGGALVKIAGPQQLIVKSDLVYRFDASNGTLRRNGDVVCERVKFFTVTESYDGVSSNVIRVTLVVFAGKQNQTNKVVQLSESYWRRAAATQ